VSNDQEDVPVEDVPVAEAIEVEPVVEEQETAVDADADADAEVDRRMRGLSRRAFMTGGVAAAVGFGAYKWLRTRPSEDGVPWPLRRVLRGNESLARAYFSPARLTPTFRPRDITKLRVNGRIGLTNDYDVNTWSLTITGGPSPAVLSLDDIRALPAHEMIAELRCIEGWSIIVKWKGARLRDLMERYPPAESTQYVGMETPGRGYYVGLDLASAMHPQTLLVYEMNDAPLTLQHGAPLRLAIPVKYGIKNIKRLSTIRYAATRPPDFWGERGYDYYAGF
jgi:hypothetical protein